MIGKIIVTEEMNKLVNEFKEADRAQPWDKRTKEWKSLEAKKELIQENLNSLVKAQAIEQLKSIGLDFNEGMLKDEENKFYLYVKTYSNVWSNGEYEPSYHIDTNQSERSNSTIATNVNTEEEIKANIENARVKQIERNKERGIDAQNKLKVLTALSIPINEYGYYNMPEYQLKDKEKRTWYGRDATINVDFSSEKVRVKVEAGFETKDPQEAIDLVKEFQEFIASRYEVKVRE